MDVHCERCNTEYDFDDSRVPEAGLAVKCSSCGHVFRVSKPGDAVEPLKSGDWRVRQQSGNVFSFKELTTLQRWIVERKVFRDDEISKTGKHWKRLGDIAELATFFQVVEAQAQPQSGSRPAAAPAEPFAPAYPQQPLYPPAPRSPVPAPALVAYPPAAGVDAPAPLPWMQPTGSWQESSGPIPDEDPFDDLPVRRGGKGKWVMLLLLLVGGGAGALYMLQPALVRGWLAPVLGGTNQLAVNHLKVGYEALYRDSYGAIDAAIENFDQAIAIDPRYPEAHAGLAEAQLARAEYLREEADTLFAGLDQLPEAERPAAVAGVESRRGEAARRSEQAFNAAKEALRLAPGSLAGARAMADYYRYKRALEQMKPLTDKAKAASPSDPGLAYVLGSSVADDPAAAERASRYFDAALEGNPRMQRARYKLARVYAAAQEKDKALLQVRSILKVVPDHERAQALLQQLEPPSAPPPVVARQQELPQAESEPKKTPAQLVRVAERLRETDQPRKALKLYEQAGEEEPEDPDIHTGAGWCYVDLEEPDAAIQSFRTALRFAPRLSDAHMGIAEAFRIKGNKAEAIEHYKAYLDIMPGGPEASVARRMIQLLQN